MPDLLLDALVEVAARFDRMLGPLSLYNSKGVQLYPAKAVQMAHSSTLLLEGEPVGAVRAESSEVAAVVADALMAHLHANYLQRNAGQTQARLIEEIKVRTELEEALKFMELKALQSQVNPHFLFNTLTTIAGVATFEDATETNELLQALSRLLRYSLRMIGQSVPLKEELSNVKDYLAIQNVRFGDRITANLDVDESIHQAQLPVLTLQPIVENSIIHGLESKEEGDLSLCAYKEDDTVIVTITDNGVGISQERLAQIASDTIDSSGRGHTTGIGLSNVEKRLQHFFGTNCSLQLESEVNRGTVVTLTIPYVY